MNNQRETRAGFAALAIPVVLLTVSLLAMCVWGFVRQRGVVAWTGWDARPAGSTWTITSVDARGGAAGKLKPGDRILAINGSPHAGLFGPPLQLATSANSYAITLERDGRSLQFVLPVLREAQYKATFAFYLLLSFVNLFVAIWIGAARPDSRTAQVAFFLFIAAAIAFGAETLQEFVPPVDGVLLGIAILFAARVWHPLEWALFFHFALRFPDDGQARPYLRFTRNAFYGIGAALSFFTLLTVLAEVFQLKSRLSLLPNWFPLAVFDSWRGMLVGEVSVMALIFGLLVLSAKYRSVADPAARARLRWVALGIGLAVAPIAIQMAATLVLDASGHADLAQRVVYFWQPITACMSALLPITFTYAIIKHRVMGIRFAIRRGVQYLLAKNILRLIWYLPLFGIAVDIALHRHEPLQDFLLHKSWWFYLLVFTSVSITLRYRKPIEQWVDKKFFRSAYEEELILSDLVEQLQSCDTSDEVARQVATKLDETFRPNGSAVLLRRDSESKFTVGYAHDAPFALQFCGEVNSSIESALETQRFPQPFSEVVSEQGAISASNTSLQETLVTPIKAPNGHVMAVLLLGAKKSEETYSARDRKLLQAVATQTGLVLEVIGLKERVREEGRVRVEVLAKLDKESVQLIVECPECGRCYARGEVTNCKADGNKLALTLPIERVIDGKYRLERRIGAGGMGAVYEATDLRLSRVVAVKVLTGRLFGNSVALRRFEREARAAARLQHPNIVPVYDFGPLPGEGAFLVMQRVTGRSWRAELERAGSIRIERAAQWFEQLCDAMIAAHASGIIHRDLKPENLLVSTGDSDAEKITVLDFGLAKVNAVEIAGDTITADSSIVGTFAYMSPEQRLGERVDARSDIYSCAVVVIEALSGCRPPQRGASTQWLRESLVWPNATPACALLLDLLDRSLASIPAERVSNMQRFQRELIPLLKSCPPLRLARAATAESGEGLTLPM